MCGAERKQRVRRGGRAEAGNRSVRYSGSVQTGKADGVPGGMCGKSSGVSKCV